MSAEWTPFRLDLSVEDVRTPSVTVPEGFYKLRCEGCDHPVKNPQTGVIGVRFRWTIVQGPDNNPNVGIGGTLPQFNTLYVPGKERNHFPLSATLVALGRTDIVEMFQKAAESQQFMDSQATANKVFDNISQAVRGREAVGDIRFREGTSTRLSSIDALHPIEKWDDLRRSFSVAPTNGPVSYTQRPTGPGAGPAQVASDNLFADLDRQI